MTTPPLPPQVEVLTCDNPSPMTLEGTNSYLISDPGAQEVVVVDPGPEGHPDHVSALVSAAGARTVTEILVSHRHPDHIGAAKLLSAQTGAPVRGMDSDVCIAGGDGTVLPLVDGEQVTVAGHSLTVLHTPGHTSDSVSFWVPAANAMLTGDTVLGRGTTMLDYPDGTLTDYLATLEKLAEYGDAMLLPAHGPAHQQMGPVVQKYREHRLERLDQASALLQEHGDLSPEDLGRLVYGENPGVDQRIITKITAAQLDHLKRG